MYKILSRNIWIKIENNKEVINFLQEGDYDIVCLQEATAQVSQWVLDQYRSFDLIQEKLMYQHSFFWDVRESDGFHHKWKDFGGFIRQWNATLSRFPITLAENKFFRRHFERRIDRSNFRQLDHWRSLTQSIIDLWDNKNIQVIHIHGWYTQDKKDTERSLYQSTFVLEQAKQYAIPTILLWDFNVDNTTESIAMIRDSYTDLTETNHIVSTRPVFDDWSESSKWNQVIDFIFVSNDIHVERFWVQNNSISDHFPLELSFTV